MNYEYEIETDYEDMDDLALPDRIEWNNEQVDGFTLTGLELIQW